MSVWASQDAGRHFGNKSWGALPTPSASLAGVRAYCTDYPGVVVGAEVICTGSRWIPVGGRRVIVDLVSDAGYAIAENTAEFVIGSAYLIPAKILGAGDTLRFGILAAFGAAQSDADAGSKNKDIKFRWQASDTGILSASYPVYFYNTSTTTRSFRYENVSRITSATAIKSIYDIKYPVDSTGTTTSNISKTIPSLDSASYIAITGKNTSLTAGSTFVLYSVQIEAIYG